MTNWFWDEDEIERYYAIREAASCELEDTFGCIGLIVATPLPRRMFWRASCVKMEGEKPRDFVVQMPYEKYRDELEQCERVLDRLVERLNDEYPTGPQLALFVGGAGR